MQSDDVHRRWRRCNATTCPVAQDRFMRETNPGRSPLILLRESVGVSPEVEARRQAIFERLNEDVARAIEEVLEEYGISDRSVAEVVSVAIGGMLERIAYQYLVSRDRSEDTERITREVLVFIRGGLLSVLRDLSRREVGVAGREKIPES